MRILTRRQRCKAFLQDRKDAKHTLVATMLEMLLRLSARNPAKCAPQQDQPTQGVPASNFGSSPKREASLSRRGQWVTENMLILHSWTAHGKSLARPNSMSMGMLSSCGNVVSSSAGFLEALSVTFKVSIMVLCIICVPFDASPSTDFCSLFKLYEPSLHGALCDMKDRLFNTYMRQEFVSGYHVVPAY
eukprot:5894914-Amphidinium_carterae.1